MPFDPEKAQHALDFAASLKTINEHGKAVNLELLDFQKEIVREIFGHYDEDGQRIVRTALLSTSRQNGKTLIAAVVLLYFLYYTPAPIDIAAVAGDKKQAAIMFRYMLKIIETTPKLADSSRTKILKSAFTIINVRTGSRFICLGGDGKLAHGFAFKVCTVDELHIFDGAEKRELYDAVKSSMGAQKESLIFYTTTASPQASGICWDEYSYAKKVKEGKIIAPTYRAFLYTNEPDVDVLDEKAWYRANPGMKADGTGTKQLSYMREAAQKAVESPSNKHSFMRLDLNVFGIGLASKWLKREDWDNCETVIDWSSLYGQDCYMGYDASTVTDLTAVAMIFPRPDGSFAVRVQCFMPKENVIKQGIHDGVDYSRWVRQGYVIATEGNLIDDQFVEKYILDQAAKYKVIEFAYDRYSAVRLAASLQNHGLVCVPISPHFSGMSEPSRFLEKIIQNQRLEHDGNPVLAHHIDCAEISIDPFDRIRPEKAGGRQGKSRIDALVSLVIGFARAQLYNSKQDVWDGRITVA